MIGQLQSAGYDAYVVGGGVRDLLLGRRPKDFDVATSASPEECKKVFRRCRLIGRRFRLAHVREHGEIIEVATFRGGANSDGVKASSSGRILRDNVFGSEQEDALRRDFTLNALFYDPQANVIHDYCGGYHDLKNRLLKLIGDPVTRYREDPVRLLRAARFEAKLGLDIEDSTAEPMAKLGRLLNDVPPARLFDEVIKLFLTGHAVGSYVSLLRHELLRVLFPQTRKALDAEEDGVSPMLHQALINTDQRVAEDKPVTPAFLYAVLLWEPLNSWRRKLEDKGVKPADALQQAAEEVLSRQVQVTAIPRRFSGMTRQIWQMQPRLRFMRGKRAAKVLDDRKFRAAYDFLLLRAVEDLELAEQVDWWTRIQDLPPDQQRNELFANVRKSKKSSRQRRGRRGGKSGK